MTHGALRISAIAIGAAAFVSLLPLSAASAATVVHQPAHGVHHAAGGVHRHVAHVHGRVYAHHYGHAHRYAYGYGYNPGAAVAAGVIGGGYPYCDDYYYGPYYGSCDYYSWGYPYWWGPGFVGGGQLPPRLRFPRGRGSVRCRKLRPHRRLWRRPLRRLWWAAASVAATWAAGTSTVNMPLA